MPVENQHKEYTRRDFLDVLDELYYLTSTKKIAKHVGDSKEVVNKKLFKLEEKEA